MNGYILEFHATEGLKSYNTILQIPSIVTGKFLKKISALNEYLPVWKTTEITNTKSSNDFILFLFTTDVF